jgi:exonuclease III
MYKRITAFCDNKKSRTRPIREGDLSTLFGLNMGKQPKNNTPTLNENLHDPDNHNSEFDPSFPPPDLNFHLSPSPVTEECITKKNDYLVVLSVNLDTTGKTSFVPSLLYAEERNADVFLLQEVENIPLNRAGILARGWTPHRHKQCMILLRTKTAGRYLRTSDDNGNSITPVWKSSTFNSMAVSINTPMGPLLITNSYLPSAVDNLSKNAARNLVVEQHLEIAERSKMYKHSILCMDGNETHCRKGRINTLCDGTIRFTGKDHSHLGTTTMAPYLKVPFLDLHRKLHSVSRPYPELEDMTHSQPGKDFIQRVDSKIDYHMTTTNISLTCISCDVDDTPKYWRNNKEPHHRKSYHSALISTFKIKGIWGVGTPEEEDHIEPPQLQGTKLVDFPRYAKLTPANSAKISELMNTAMHKRKLETLGIMKSTKITTSKKADLMVNIFTKELLHASKSVLGVARHSSGPDQKKQDVMNQWDEMAHYIGQALNLSSIPKDIFDLQTYTKKIDDFKMSGYRAYFSMKLPETHFPVDKDGWITWWHSKDVLKADAFGINDDILLTDHKALTQPKRFFEDAQNPFHLNTSML